MDVNGTRFHLIAGQVDWRACRLEGQPIEVQDWYPYLEKGGSYDWLHVGWDTPSQTLTLRPLLSLFPRGTRDAPLQPSARRGAAVDRFGNWYWIGNDRQRIFWKPSGSARPQVYWTPTATPCPEPPGAFRPHTEVQLLATELAGLAVTAHHYLVVGNTTQGGLFIFDLHAGGEPLLLLFPDVASSPPKHFEPFDMAPAPDGGVWVLDRTHRTYWGLDRHFRVVTEPGHMDAVEPAAGSAFRPVDGAAVVRPNHRFPSGFPLDAQDPLSIEAMPDGSVLILDNPPEALSGSTSPAVSTLYHYHLGQRLHEVALEDDVEVAVEGQGTVQQHLSLSGHDIAYTPGDKTLYVVERDGNQSIACVLDFVASKPLTVRRDYLPMHFFGSRALVAWKNKVFYDVVGGDPANDAAVRWVQLQTIDQPRYQRTATLLTPIFDGKERACVWHRPFIDACIPPGTSLEVWTRAADDPQALQAQSFAPEPALYLRGAGTEIPYYQAFPEHEQPSETTGTWELLFQQARGRYLQIKLVLSGNGRNSPQLRALRTYYPRFSYPKRYLPAVYQDDTESASFLERLLANMEGFYTEIEGKIVEVRTLLDARTAPAETLNWLAGWLGLVLDPLWAEIQEQRQSTTSPIQKSSKLPPDRRRLFIRYALTLYDRRGTPDGLRFALQLLLHPCLEDVLQRFKAAAVQANPTLREELDFLGLPHPTTTMSEEELEALLHDYILTPKRPSKVRIVERFMARDGRAVAAGDPTQAGATVGGEETILASAHRFSVLVPEDLSSAEGAMVERIINLEKPAHTLFDVRRYWDYFRAGEARLGLDTVLGQEGRFVPMLLGRDYLAEGYLSSAHPMDVRERLISDRDRPGQRPL